MIQQFLKTLLAFQTSKIRKFRRNKPIKIFFYCSAILFVGLILANIFWLKNDLAFPVNLFLYSGFLICLVGAEKANHLSQKLSF
jgi:hypothetical protein